MHWPLTAQLSLPEAWATDGARRAKVHVPAAVALQTKPELALALVDRARAWGVPFAWAVADAGDGDNPTFVQGLEARQIAYVVGVSSSFGVRLPDEVHAAALVQPSRPRGPARGPLADEHLARARGHGPAPTVCGGAGA